MSFSALLAHVLLATTAFALPAAQHFASGQERRSITRRFPSNGTVARQVGSEPPQQIGGHGFQLAGLVLRSTTSVRTVSRNKLFTGLALITSIFQESFSSVSAEFVVPFFSPGDTYTGDSGNDQQESVGIWVGIGNYYYCQSDNGVAVGIDLQIQGGVAQISGTCYAGPPCFFLHSGWKMSCCTCLLTSPLRAAWYEFAIEGRTWLDFDHGISSGQTIYLSAAGSSGVTIEVWNKDTDEAIGQAFTNLPAPICGEDVEWVVEEYSLDDSPEGVPYFPKGVVFTNPISGSQGTDFTSQLINVVGTDADPSATFLQASIDESSNVIVSYLGDS